MISTLEGEFPHLATVVSLGGDRGSFVVVADVLIEATDGLQIHRSPSYRGAAGLQHHSYSIRLDLAV